MIAVGAVAYLIKIQLHKELLVITRKWPKEDITTRLHYEGSSRGYFVVKKKT
jgi:hypothetical protein